ncbi:MAG: plastocyanin/azurin family copper-binding protein [Pseudomonadota bacterium]
MARLSHLSHFAAGLLAAASVPAAAASPEEQAQICAEAAARYQETFGKAMTDEAVQIIAMYKHTFCPPKLTVKQGSRVRFINLDKRTTHSFWFRDAGRPESERYFGGEGSEMTMDLPPGTHTYLCGPHFEREGMVGEITITP